MRLPESLATARLRLRRPELGDAAAIFAEYAQDPEVTRYLTWRPHADAEQTASFLARCHAGWESGGELTWALTLAGSDRVVGMLATQPDGFKANLGYVLARRLWGQGLMTEAGSALVGCLLERAEIFRVWAVTDVENRASARVLTKLGMTCEGTLRRWMSHPNVSVEPRDCLVFAKVRE